MKICYKISNVKFTHSRESKFITLIKSFICPNSFIHTSHETNTNFMSITRVAHTSLAFWQWNEWSWRCFTGAVVALQRMRRFYNFTPFYFQNTQKPITFIQNDKKKTQKNESLSLQKCSINNGNNDKMQFPFKNRCAQEHHPQLTKCPCVI